MTVIKMGAIKYKSVAAAVRAAQRKNPKLSYMTVYMRIRAGQKAGSAIQAPVRKYEKKAA